MARYELRPEEKERIAQEALDTRLRALYQTELEAISEDPTAPGGVGNAKIRVAVISDQVEVLKAKLQEAEAEAEQVRARRQKK